MAQHLRENRIGTREAVWLIAHVMVATALVSAILYAISQLEDSSVASAETVVAIPDDGGVKVDSPRAQPVKAKKASPRTTTTTTTLAKQTRPKTTTSTTTTTTLPDQSTKSELFAN